MIMKRCILVFTLLFVGMLNAAVFSQTEENPDLIGLAGDNLNLYAVLDLFQKSKTIEEFEKSLNTQETGINNLDLNLDQKVDFIKVETQQDGNDFNFILRVAVNEKETQDVAVILVSKDKEGKVSIQIVGDVELYGKDYIVEPTTSTKPAVTANPAYTGTEPVASAPATTTVVVVESTPIVQYVYSPVYVPYYPPPMPPPYFVAFTVIAVSTYHHNHYYHGYPPCGHGNTVVIHNTNNFNNYNNNYRRTSNTVNHNRINGDYNGGRNNVSNGNRPTTNDVNRQNNNVSNNKANNKAVSTSNSGNNRAATKTSTSNRSTTKQSSTRTRSSRSRSGGR